MGIRGGVSRTTLAKANEQRDWRIYADFAQALIRIARPLYADEDLGLDILLPEGGACFVIRDKSTGLRCDQTIVLTGLNTPGYYPTPLRRIKYHDTKTGKTFNFMANNFTIPALTAADLYRYRWQVELFFKWIKQHLRIKSFFGASENAVRTQVWIAIFVYVLVAIIKKRLKLEASLYTILQILSVT